MTTNLLLFSFSIVLVLLSFGLLTIPVAVAGGSTEREEVGVLPAVKQRKSERRLLKGRVDDSHHHHHHHHNGDGAGSFEQAHHDTINPMAKQKGGKEHHHQHEYLGGGKGNNQGLIMTVVSDGCGHIGRKQHCPPIDICVIQGVVDISANLDPYEQRVLSPGESKEMDYLDSGNLPEQDHDNDPDDLSMDVLVKREQSAADNDHHSSYEVDQDEYETMDALLLDYESEGIILEDRGGARGGVGAGGGGGGEPSVSGVDTEGTGILDTEQHDVSSDVDVREVGWDGFIVPTITSLMPTRRPTLKVSSTVKPPTPKPSIRKPAGSTPIKSLVSLSSFLPSRIPTVYPTRKPFTRKPSRKPSTRKPSYAPTPSCPSSQPTSRPTSIPTSEPTPEPTPDPTSEPSLKPTAPPTKSLTPPPVKIVSPPVSSPSTPQINTANNLVNHGGRVMTSTQTVAIFWGPKWALSSFVSDKITGIDAFYQGYANSNYAAIVTQYAGSNGPITVLSTYLGHYIDTSSTSGTATPPTHSDIFKEST